MERLCLRKSRINGTGLFTNHTLKRGDFVGYIHGPLKVVKKFTPALSERSRNWIGVGRYTWIDTSASPFRYINHSCAPNVAIVSARKVIALTTIPAGTELTMDYSLTEADPDWCIPRCSCGTALCRGRITPIYQLPRKVFEKYKAFMPKNFIRIYESSVPQ